MRPARFPVLGGLALCAALLSCGGPPGPTAPSLSSFSVTPSSVLSGVATDVTFSFSYDNTPTPPVSCTIDGVGSVTDGRQSTLTLTANTTFTLRCSNAAGESTKDASVTVVQPVAPQLATFSANPSSAVVGTPTDVTWTWQYSNTPVPLPTCSIDRNVGTVTSGATTSVTVSNNAVFNLTCTNVAGTASKYVSITAVAATVAPSISAFLAIPSSVVAGAPSSVKWSWTYSNPQPTPAPTCSIDQGVGTVTNASSTTLTLASNTTYTLTCVNSAGTGTRQTTVMVSPPVGPTLNGFVASPTTVVSGVATNVTWTWTYGNSPVPAPTCSIDQGVGALTNGSVRSITITADTVFTLTCTNTGGTSTRQVTVTLAPPTAPTIATFSASPNFVGQGIPTNIQWNWTYSATPNPAPTCSIDQSVGAVTNGQVTQVNLTAATTYTLTCTNVGGTGTGQATISIVPVSNGITNGTFETGSLVGWTTLGSTSAVTGGHSGTYAARTGLITQTLGDSSISQTFTTPAGVTSLTFWYRVVCLDSVSFDWGTATLRNNSTGITTTVLARQCSNSGLWQQVTTSVTGNTSYTLTLTNHDDNLSADPTYTLYDDVTLQ